MTITIPLFVAFYPENVSSYGFLVVSIIVTIIYLFDIILSFRTTYIDSATFEEIIDKKKIMKQYCFSLKFPVDILSTIPFEFASPSTIAFLRILKIYKIMSLSNLISIMKLNQILKHILKFAILLSFLILFIHFIACAFFLIINIPDEFDIYYGMTTSKKYWISIYHSVYFITGILNPLERSEQYIFFSIFYVIGAVLLAVLLGYMTLLIRNARKRDTIFNETSNTLSTAMKNLRLDSSLRFKIIEFFTSNYNLLKHNSEYMKFLEILPPSLVTSLNRKFLSQMIKMSKILSSSPKTLDFALVRLRTAFYQPGVHVISQFEDPTNLYFVVNGICHVDVIDEEKRFHLVGQLSEGDHFGEISLLFNTEATATVVTSSYTSLAYMNQRSFTEILDLFPDAQTIFLTKITEYQDN